MSLERFHSPQHIREYDTAYIGLPGGDLEIVVEEIDDLLYPGIDLSRPVGAQRARAGDGMVFAGFTHEYLRTDTSTMGWSVESVRLSIDHTQYLGGSALKQCYKIKLDTSVEQSVIRGIPQVIPPKNRVTSIYYLEEFPSGVVENSFHGHILRPNIIGDQNQSDEQMTAYDCERLFRVVAEARRIMQRPDINTNVL